MQNDEFFQVSVVASQRYVHELPLQEPPSNFIIAGGVWGLILVPSDPHLLPMDKMCTFNKKVTILDFAPSSFNFKVKS